MPTNVFFNLKPNKQKRILDVAIQEFSEYPLEEVSIKRIVEGASIARGSFYQYFDDIDDLFVYILNLAKEHIQTYKKNEMELHPTMDFIEFVRHSIFQNLSLLLDNKSSNTDFRLMNKVMQSNRAQRLFIEHIGFSKSVSELKDYFMKMDFHQNFDQKTIDIIIEMTFSVIEKTVYKLLRGEMSKDEALHEINLKLELIANGLNG